MQHYAAYGHQDFYLALGYKAEKIKEYFLNYRALNTDFTINLKSGILHPHQGGAVDWRVTLINTGEKTMTGGRVKRLKEYIGNETFLLTYGDGLSNIKIDELITFHRQHKKLVTVTAVRPIARFGELKIEKEIVSSFQEKPQMHEGWINGGFFVVEPEFLEMIEGDETLLEREPLERAVRNRQLIAYRHEGFWQCMDTKRDYEILEAMWNSGEPPWSSSPTEK
jgi:glucose-1-phosphate cytidylyltransferase